MASVVLLCWTLGRPHLQSCTQIWVSHAGACPEKGTKLGKGLEHKTDKEQPGEKEARGESSLFLQLPDRRMEPGGDQSLCQVTHNRGNGLKLCCARGGLAWLGKTLR